jgi:DNA-binding FadR family transcriptional regulator
MFDSFQGALSEGLERIREDVDLAAVDNTEAHADLVGAIRARDQEAAAAATARLLAGTTDTIRSLLRRRS